MNTTLDHALGYAANGWPVLPLEPRSKHPLGALVPHGFHDASTDPDQIRIWWATSPEAGVGVVTGPASGLLVLDVDARNGGFESLGKLPRRLPYTRVSITGGGGQHHLFAWPTTPIRCRSHALGPGLDAKGAGYVVAPPSVHPSGARYKWFDAKAPILPAPEWLLAMLAPPAPPAIVPRPPSARVPGRAMSAEERAHRWISKIPGAISGSGGHASTYAVALGLVVGFELGLDDALEILMEWNSTCSPPWSLSELRHKVESAATSASAPTRGYLLARDRMVA